MGRARRELQGCEDRPWPCRRRCRYRARFGACVLELAAKRPANGWDIQEIALWLGMSEAAVHRALHDAKRKIARALEGAERRSANGN